MSDLQSASRQTVLESAANKLGGNFGSFVAEFDICSIATLGGGKVEQGGAIQGFPPMKTLKTNVGGKVVHRGATLWFSREMLNSS